MSAMRVVIVGAGAVGAVVGTLLANAGHEVWFWLGARPRLARETLSVQRRGGPRVSTAPRWLRAGDVIQASDWVIVCVRGEQLEDALADVRAYFGPERRVAIAAVSLSRVVAQARASGLSGEVYALHVSFGSYLDERDPGLFHWFPFVTPSTVTPDGARAYLPQARALARALAAAGLPAAARLTMSGTMRFLVAMNSVLALGWDLAGWELAALARNPVLRAQTAAALHESLPLALPARSPLRLLPRAGFSLFLRVFPRLMSARGREVWLRHGPKIRAQTEYITRQLIELGETAGNATPRLRELYSRWQGGLGKR